MSGITRIHFNRSNLPKDDASKENVIPKQTRAGNSKRSALGNVTNQMRIQPQRVAKGKVLSRVADGQENIRGGKVAASFTIFEDTQVPPAAVIPTHQSNKLHSCDDDENKVSELNALVHEVAHSKSRGLHYHHPLEHLHSDHAADSPMYVEYSCSSNDNSFVRHDEFGLHPYFKDIYSYLRSTECLGRPSKDYMNRQTDVTTSMRNILVDWLVEVNEEYKLQRETLFLAINYIDRFLGMVGVFRPKLQLVGAASMFIAAKYEEIYPPDVAEFVYITDDTYTKNQVIKMEGVILKMLEFKVAVPTINWFCERFIGLMDMTDRTKFLTFFLTELSLIEIEEFLVYSPSVIAASAIVLAHSILNIKEPWPKSMEEASCYTLTDLIPCIKQLYSLYTRKDVMPQQAVIEKYKKEKFGSVSTIVPPHILAIF